MLEWTTVELEPAPDVRIRALHGRHGVTATPVPTLVLLHEALGCIAMWKDVPQQLAARTGCDVFVYERRGYGGSTPIALPRPGDYLEQEGRDWLARILDSAAITGPVILVGHSDGGSIALVGAAVLGERVLGLVTMAAHIYIDHLTLAGIGEAVARYHAPGSDLPARLARYHGERTDLLFRAWHETWARPAYATFDLSPWLSDIRCQALIMQGVDDQYGVPEQVSDICAGIGPRAQPLLIPDCGHIPHLEAPQQSLTAIVEFVARL
ncbi:alpha/beta fold hydrolase [Marinobacterium rhizophilum]|uniref:Alpha/beta fold hydrolase n=1 Tax=Marinobacterium rhizophilum TaxID=420402 RepID=A0ABY5HLK9_9GAMM|nr:alpha/beta fold hydrolase [Marinobacterium rhizophilum]UTW12776.1 alpha/beta fold hydrolase [Marinobacterium rhizophilum]